MIDDFNDPVLSSEQSAAVDSDAKALVVIAGAGSGKTEVVARRIERLLSERPDDRGRVLALTYTVKASDELRERLDARIGAPARRVDSDTIHGFAHNLLRTHGTRIGLPVEPELLVRDEDRAELFRSWLSDRGEGELANVKELLVGVDLARARGQSADRLDEWCQALEDNGALDYPALLARATELLGVASVVRQTLYMSIVVDEAQNLTRAQYDLIVALASDNGEVSIPMMLVGDDKQSIVSFAGADPQLIGQFASEFNAERHQLATNFRSATSLADIANRVASELGHPAGDLRAFAAPGSISFQELESEQVEGAAVAEWIRSLLEDGIPAAALGDGENSSIRPEAIAVLCRSAAGLRFVARELEQTGIAFSVASSPSDWLTTSAGRVLLELVGLRGAPSHHSFYWELGRLLDRVLPVESVEEVRTALSSSDDELARSLVGVLDLADVSELLPFLREVDVSREVNDSEAANWLSDIDQFAKSWAQFDRLTARNDLTWANFKLFCARAQRGGDFASGVRLMTVHKSQGREYAAVAVVGMNDGQFPDFRAKSESALRDELRTFYVAITRARRVLLLTRPKQRETRYGSRATDRSRFLTFLQE